MQRDSQENSTFFSNLSYDVRNFGYFVQDHALLSVLVVALFVTPVVLAFTLQPEPITPIKLIDIGDTIVVDTPMGTVALVGDHAASEYLLDLIGSEQSE